MEQVVHRLLLGVIVIACLLLTSKIARADAPITRGPEPSAIGGGSSNVTWAGVQPLAPVTALAPAGLPQAAVVPVESTSSGVGAPALYGALSGSNSTPYNQPSGDWLTRSLNPGNWVMDAGLGIMAGVFRSLSDSFLVALQTFLRASPENVSQIDVCTPVLFCWPTDVLTSGIMERIWKALTPIAIGLMTILFVIRIGRAIANIGNLGGEGRDLFVAYLLSTMVVVNGRFLIETLVGLFNGINAVVLASIDRVSLANLPPAPSFDLPSSVMMLVWILLMVWIVLRSMVRLFKLFVLLAFMPLMGAFLMERGTAHTYANWLARVVGLMAEQTTWVLAFATGSSIVSQMAGPVEIGSPQANYVGILVRAIAGLILALIAHAILNDLYTAGTTVTATSARTSSWHGMRDMLAAGASIAAWTGAGHTTSMISQSMRASRITGAPGAPGTPMPSPAPTFGIGQASTVRPIRRRIPLHNQRNAASGPPAPRGRQFLVQVASRESADSGHAAVTGRTGPTVAPTTSTTDSGPARPGPQTDVLINLGEVLPPKTESAAFRVLTRRAQAAQLAALNSESSGGSKPSRPTRRARWQPGTARVLLSEPTRQPSTIPAA